MSRWLKCICLLLVVFGIGREANAQYFISPTDPVYLKWKRIANKSDGDIIFPDYLADKGYYVSFLRDTLKSKINYNLGGKLGKFNVTLHPTNLLSNGLVTYTPSRMELYTMPSRDNMSLPWLKHLVAHEYRHVAQLSKLNQGFTKTLSYILGEQMFGLTAATVSTYIYEGDAVVAETQFAMYGRGKQPSFNTPLRALLIDGEKLNVATIRMGALNKYAPDPYIMGYHVTQYGTDTFGDNFWSDCITFAARNPYLIDPLLFVFKGRYNTSSGKMTRATFNRLHDFWEPLTVNQKNSATIIDNNPVYYTNYQSPLYLNDSTILSIKSDYSSPNKIVATNIKTGKQRVITSIGSLSSYMYIDSGKLFWGEITPSLSWGQKNFSTLYSYDLNKKRKRREYSSTSFFFTPYGEDKILAVEYDINNNPQLITLSKDGYKELSRYDIFDSNVSLNGIAYNPKDGMIYCAVVDNNGTSIVRVNLSDMSSEYFIEPSYNTITNLSCYDGSLLYTSINSGQEEVYMYNLAEGAEYKLTNSRYGSTGASLSKDGESIATTTYTHNGFLLSTQKVHKESRSSWQKMPSDKYNYNYKEWNIIKLDTINFEAHTIDKYISSKEIKRYNKTANLFNLHSYIPLYVDTEALISSLSFRGGVGATLLSQNMLNSMVTSFSYGYVNGHNLYKLGVDYTALPVHISFDLEHGGKYQSIYSLSGSNVNSIDEYSEVSVDLSLPLNLSGGGRNRYFRATLGYSYVNDLYTTLSNKRFVNTEGVNRIEYHISYQSTSHSARMNLNPKWGYLAQFSAITNPFNNNAASLFALYLKGFLPGPFRNGSIVLEAAKLYQTDNIIYYGETILLPRGITIENAVKRSYSSSIDYRVPLFYPNGGLGTLLHFQRISGAIFTDYAHYQYINSDKWVSKATFGGAVVISFNAFNLRNLMNLELSVYKPNDSSKLSTGVAFSVDF